MAKKRERKNLSGLREETEYEQKLLDLARVTRVVAGGKRMRFRACIVIGDRRGTVGVGIAKGADVSDAINKAVRQAKKSLIKLNLVDDTIPHWIKEKYKSAEVLIRPAGKGRGIVAGGAPRAVLGLVGVKNATAKMLGSSNKINNARATINALLKLKLPLVKNN
ncbi:MAG: 30S ribosomal protein S5 [Patescibacteria group bacterium]